MAPSFEERQDILDKFDEHFMGKDGRFKEREYQKEIYYEVVKLSKETEVLSTAVKKCPVLTDNKKFEDVHKNGNGNGKDKISFKGTMDGGKVRNFIIYFMLVIATIAGSAGAMKLLGV